MSRKQRDTLAGMSVESRAEAANEQLRLTIREARECIKDLRELIREARAFTEEAKTIVPTLTDSMIRDEVGAQFERLGVEMNEMVEKGTEVVLKRFDNLSAHLLGETKTRADKGQPSIPKIIEAVAYLREVERDIDGQAT